MALGMRTASWWRFRSPTWGNVLPQSGQSQSLLSVLLGGIVGCRGTTSIVMIRISKEALEDDDIRGGPVMLYRRLDDKAGTATGIGDATSERNSKAFFSCGFAMTR